MKRGSPGGLCHIILGSALSLCAYGTASADADPRLPAPSSPLELNAEASDAGSYWPKETDKSASAKLLLTADPEINRTITFRAGNLTTPFGELELHGGVGQVETSDALTFDRLLSPDNFAQDNSAIGLGVSERLFDGRLLVSTDMAWSTDTSSWRDPSAPFAPEIDRRQGAARWHRLEAKVIDSDDLKWSFKAEISAIDDGYAGTSGAQPQGMLAFRGDREKWSTQIDAFGASSVASSERVCNRLLQRNTDRVTFDLGGVDAAFYAKDVQRMSLTDPVSWTSRSDVRGLSLDIVPRLLAAGLFDASLRSPLIPNLISLGWETGALAYPDAASERIGSLQAMAQWKTVLGDTTALYWRERQGPLSAGGDAGDDNQMFDLTQGFKVGDWHFSAGATAIAFQHAGLDGAFADTAVSGHFSLRYAPETGPQLDLALGHHHDQFEIESDDLIERTLATTLSLSVDVSDYVQRELDRRDTHLKLEYRHELSQDEFSYESLTASAEAARSADTALLSFRTPL